MVCCWSHSLPCYSLWGFSKGLAAFLRFFYPLSTIASHSFSQRTSNLAPFRRRSSRLEYVACESDSNGDLIVPLKALCGGLSFCVTSGEIKCTVKDGHTHSHRLFTWDFSIFPLSVLSFLCFQWSREPHDQIRKGRWRRLYLCCYKQNGSEQ